MKRFLKRLLILPMLASVVLGQGCTKGPSAEAVKLSKRVVMNVWGVVDDVDAYQEIFNDFRKQHPNADIRFRRFRLEEYEQELLNALAEDRGPDLFMIHNTWTDKYLPKIFPAPKTVKTAVQTVTGTIKKEVTYGVVNEPTISLKQLRNDFADVVAPNAVRKVNVAVNPDERLI
ncbi:MAG TPA: extracellular solute-binding protein, partial [Candidatus Methylomirabilis sp.]|nr:extracellular solute-binding protein [Candidatus Methylomirabilis sp.]